MSVTKYFIGIKNIKNENPLDLNLKNLNIIIPKKNTFIADPFLFKYKEDYYVFFEEWNYSYGCICCSKLDEKLNFTNIEKCIDTKSHLSFPCIFEYKDNIYMMPESIASGHGIDIYKCINFPLNWIKINTINNILESTDPIFFCHNDLIYIFCGSEKYLKIFYSTDFNNFTEHPINKENIKTNARSAGNIFFYQENYYRPAQICEPNYGYGIALYRIDILDTISYKETLIKEIKPDWFPKLTGTHTFNICKDLFVIDGRLRVETPYKEWTGKVWKSTDDDEYVNIHIDKLKLNYLDIKYSQSKQNWNEQKIIDNYCSKIHIQGGELKIIEILKNSSNFSSMLDIGVGGGRTTYHFSKLFKTYLGIDIADKYLDYLIEKYPDCNFEINNIILFEIKEKYDFILFSHNGIDCIYDINDYLLIINKMYNLCEINGFIAFSSHNLLYKGIKKDYEIFYENVCGVKDISIFYTNPYFIYENLKKFNFNDIKLIDRNGNEIFIDNFTDDWKKNEYTWLYYLCRK